MDEKEIKRRIKAGRNFMKFRAEDENSDFISDQQLKKPQPPLCKEKTGNCLIALSKDFDALNINKDFTTILMERKSHRIFSQKKMTLPQLSYLLYMTQGVKGIRGENYATMRTVPSGGARHGFETYLIVNQVEGLKAGKYHYLPMTHELEFLGNIDHAEEIIDETLVGQKWAVKANVIFYWSFVAYRCEWRYGIYAHRPALIDAGHVGQNLYLACSALGLGTCCLAAFDDYKCNETFALDGEEEFVVYAAPAGTID